MKRLHLIIIGDVQGVGYRSWVLRKALELQITGWVKNREDGAVEIVAEGKEENLQKLLTSCRKGPEVAWVKGVKVAWQNATGEFLTFEIRIP